MNLLFILLQNQVEVSGSGGGYANIIFIVAMVAIFYFFMIRPQTKRQKDIKTFRESLKVGDRVITSGGIYGKIKEIKDDSFVVSISDSVNIRISKESVYQSAAEQQQQ